MISWDDDLDTQNLSGLGSKPGKPSRNIPGIPQVQEDLLQVGHGVEVHVAHPGDDERLQHVLRRVST